VHRPRNLEPVSLPPVSPLAPREDTGAPAAPKPVSNDSVLAGRVGVQPTPVAGPLSEVPESSMSQGQPGLHPNQIQREDASHTGGTAPERGRPPVPTSAAERPRPAPPLVQVPTSEATRNATPGKPTSPRSEVAVGPVPGPVAPSMTSPLNNPATAARIRPDPSGGR
jgi:hypothetical protein